MIRRSPTLISMSDMDVQDIRDMVANEKANALRNQSLILKMKRLVDDPNMSKDDFEMLADITKKQQEEKEREKAKRLGLNA